MGRRQTQTKYGSCWVDKPFGFDECDAHLSALGIKRMEKQNATNMSYAYSRIWYEL